MVDRVEFGPDWARVSEDGIVLQLLVAAEGFPLPEPGLGAVLLKFVQNEAQLDAVVAGRAKPDTVQFAAGPDTLLSLAARLTELANTLKKNN